MAQLREVRGARLADKNNSREQAHQHADASLEEVHGRTRGGQLEGKKMADDTAGNHRPKVRLRPSNSATRQRFAHLFARV